YNQNIAQGSAFSHTLAYALTLPYRYLPQLDIVARNVGGTHYQSSSLWKFAPNPTGTPPSEQTSFDASFSLFTKNRGVSQGNYVLELRDLSNTSHITMLGRVAGGFEYTFFDTVAFRAGYGSGYPNAGIGLKR